MVETGGEGMDGYGCEKGGTCGRVGVCEGCACRKGCEERRERDEKKRRPSVLEKSGRSDGKQTGISR